MSGQLDVDEDAFPTFADPAKSAQTAKAWGAGLNWYWNRNVKWMLDYERTLLPAALLAAKTARQKMPSLLAYRLRSKDLKTTENEKVNKMNTKNIFFPY